MPGFQQVTGPIFAGSDAESRVNAGFIRTAKGVFVVDTLVTPEDGAALRDAAEAEGGQITAMVFTHEHGDHTIGSSVFPPGGVIASEGTARGVEVEAKHWPGAGAGPKSPTVIFDSKVTLPWEPKIVIVELGGHAQGSSVVYVPEHRVLFSGDLVFRGRAAYVGSMRPERWLASLRTLEGWDVKTVIPGHGPVGGPEILAEQRVWLEKFLARARGLREKGAPLEEAFATVKAEFGFASRQDESLRKCLVERLGFSGDGWEE